MFTKTKVEFIVSNQFGQFTRAPGWTAKVYGIAVFKMTMDFQAFGTAGRWNSPALSPYLRAALSWMIQFSWLSWVLPAPKNSEALEHLELTRSNRHQTSGSSGARGLRGGGSPLGTWDIFGDKYWCGSGTVGSRSLQPPSAAGRKKMVAMLWVPNLYPPWKPSPWTPICLGWPTRH